MPVLPAPGAPPGGKAYQPPTTGPVTAKEVYYLLLQHGASTVQAIGIMANAINESGLNPEAVGDGGTSFGFVQFHEPGYAGASSLVTGDPQRDIRAQISYFFKVVPKGALAGSSGSAVAGNVASQFERCVGCQPGGAQYQGRVANAAKVAGWVASGKWPNAATSTVGSGSSSGSGNANGTGAATGPGSACLVSAPSLSLPVVGQVAGGGCLFTKSNARAFAAVGVLVAGGITLAIGVLVLAAYGLKSTGAGKIAGRAMEAAGAVTAVAGAPEIGAPLAAAGAETRSASRRSQEEAQERHTARQYARQPQARARLDRDNSRQREPVPF